jgi:hypothetical protein
MSEVKLPFGLRADTGAIVSVEAVARGLACECICPACRWPLVAAKGEVVRHHFRHLAENPACREARETALHLFAKKVICDTLNLQLPQDLGQMRSAVSEAIQDDLRFDVLATYDSEDVAVEVFVAHRVGLEKVQKLVERGITALEIDLSSFRDADLDEIAWREAVLARAPRRWLNAPAFVRRALAILVERMKEDERRAYEAARLAQIARDKAREAWEIEQQEGRAKIAEQEAATAELRRKEAEVEHQRKEREDARAREIELQRQPPKLLDLVRAHGGYDKITPEAWARWDEEIKLYKSRVATGYFYNK